MRISAGGSRKAPGWDLQNIPLPKCKSCWVVLGAEISHKGIVFKWGGGGEHSGVFYFQWSCGWEYFGCLSAQTNAKDSPSQPDLCQQGDDQMLPVSCGSWSSDFTFCDRIPVPITRIYFGDISRAKQPDSKLGKNQNPAGSAEAGIWKQKASPHGN